MRRQEQPTGKTFAHDAEVDFVIIGSGIAGGSVARELTAKGFDVLVLEQGRHVPPSDMEHDELGAFVTNRWTNTPEQSPQTYRPSADAKAERRHFLQYARVVGGTTLHFTGNFWRFRPIDFNEFSQRGAVAGANVADWPITYDELEPYYTAVEYAMGISGEVGSDPREPKRSKPFPLPPLNVTGPGVLLEVGAKKLGWHSKAAPMAILSRAYNGRQPCHNCGFCLGFPCEWGAKSGSNWTMIPDALRSGRCEVRADSYVHRIETDASGRVTGVLYFDAKKQEQRQKAKAVVLSANGAETPRLLLMSTSNRFPNGLANSSGVVGKHLMFNGNIVADGLFEHEVHGHKGPVVTRITQEHYVPDPSLNFFGGGGIDMRFDVPAMIRTLGMPPDGPEWGLAWKQRAREWFTHSAAAYGHTSTLPVSTNAVTLDPDVKDAWGMPAIRSTYREHAHDMKLFKFMQERCEELLTAAGAKKVYPTPFGETPGAAVHLLGTARMGNDPSTSVVDKYHRAHDVPNLFIVDGSSFVTSGRGQPTMTIQALAFRAADHIAQFATRREI